MDGWKLWFVLPLCVCADSRVTVVKATGRGPSITPVCISENLGVVLLVTCRISTERRHTEECSLLYTDDKHFDHDCDSRFTLLNKNGTVFIQLTGLTPVDSGNYTCECSFERGTHVVRLSLTVESDEEDNTLSHMKFMPTVVILAISVATTVISTAGIICSHILRRHCCRENTSGASELARSETVQSLDEDDLYTSLQQPASDVYQTISSSRPHPDDAEASPTSTDVNYCNTVETHGKEYDLHPAYAVYETI